MRDIRNKGLGNAYVRATFQALVDAIMPPAARPTDVAGASAAPGAASLRIDEYVIGRLDHSRFVPADTPSLAEFPLSLSTALLLDMGAADLRSRGLAVYPPDGRTFPCGGSFATMARIDRLRALAWINGLRIPLSVLPLPYRDNPGLVLTMMDSLHQLTLFGYYSEWYGYGSTRLLPPQDQRLECFPPGWRLAGYPGPACGYRALRGGAPPGARVSGVMRLA